MLEVLSLVEVGGPLVGSLAPQGSPSGSIQVAVAPGGAVVVAWPYRGGLKLNSLVELVGPLVKSLAPHG